MANGRPFDPGRRRHRFALGAAAALVACSLAVGLLWGLNGTRGPDAAAASLKQLASVEGAGSPALGPHQWIESHVRATFVVASGPNATAGSSAPVARLSATIESWANTESTCTQSTFGTPQFPSAQGRQRWVDSGLSLSPIADRPNGICSLDGGPFSGPIDELGNGIGVIDVSKLPTDPATLARQLDAGDTGNALLDQAISASAPSAGFQRAVLLLTLPKVDEGADFQSRLYTAMSEMPDVVSLGVTTTPGGQTGIGFASGTQADDPQVVVDPSTGALLEGKNLACSGLYFAGGEQQFWNPGSPTTDQGIAVSAGNVIVATIVPVGRERIVSSVPPFGDAF